MSALQGLRDVWSGRSPRERRMLAVLGVLLAAFIGWYGVASPLLSWREASADRLAAARSRAEVVQRGVERLRGGPRAAALAVGDLDAVARQTAQEAGVMLETSDAGDGALEFSVESATSAGLFGWLGALETAHGVAITDLNVAENADATLQAQGRLKGG